MLRADRLSPLAVFHLNGLGDRLMALPTIRSLSRCLDGELSIIGDIGDWNRFYRGLRVRNVFERDSSLLPFDTLLVEHSAFLSLNTWHNSDVERLLQTLVGVHSLGYFDHYDMEVKLNSEIHACDDYFQFALCFDSTLKIERFAFPPIPSFETISRVSRLRSRWPVGSKVLSVHSETKTNKMWPVARLRVMLAQFLAAHPEFIVVILDQRDRGLTPVGYKHRVRVYEDLSLDEAILLIGCSDFFVGIDSCMLHAADLLKVPGVGIFGPTRPERFGFRFSKHGHVSGSPGLEHLQESSVLVMLEEILEACPAERKPWHPSKDPVLDNPVLDSFLAVLRADPLLMEEFAGLAACPEEWCRWARGKDLDVSEKDLCCLLSRSDKVVKAQGALAPYSRQEFTSTFVQQNGGDEEMKIEDPVVKEGAQVAESARKLLEPIEMDEFLAKNWQVAPLWLCRSSPDIYRSLFSIDDVDRFVTVASRSSDHMLTVLPPASSGRKQYTKRLQDVSLGQIYHIFFTGDTFKINKVQLSWSSCNALAVSLRSAYRADIDIILQVTPPSRQRVTFEVARRDLFLLQVFGSMRCTLYRPQYVWPVDGLECIEYVGDPADVAGDEVAGEQVERGDLNTGDLLYIPRGFSFSASTNGEPSLQLLAAVRPLYWVDVLKAALELTCLECEELRGAIHPRLHAADPEVRELAVETLSRMFENAVRKTRPGDVFDFLDRSHALGSRLPADGHFRNMVDIDCISPESTVARREGVHCLVERSDDWAVMRFAGSEVRASLITLEAMDYIKRAHLFRVKDLPGGLSSNAKVVLVRRLVREGLLQVKGSHAR